MKKRFFAVLIGVICLLLAVFTVCGCGDSEEKPVAVSDAPRFDGLNISEISPLADNENGIESSSIAVKNAANASDAEQTDKPLTDSADEKIEVPKDDMPDQAGSSVDVKEEIISELEKNNDFGVDEANASASFYAELNQDVYITISLINPKSYSILRFTLNGTVYQSYQFESGSTSTMLVLKVNSGNVCGIKEFTIDEIKYVDDSDNNKIKDVIIEGNRSVKLCVAYDKVPTVEVLNESMDYNKYSADFYISDYYGLADYDGGLRMYFYDGVEKKQEIKLNKGSNNVAFDSLVMGNTYKCVIVGLYDRYDSDGFCAHVIYENEIKPSGFCSFTDVSADFDSISFDYKVYNTIAEVLDIILFDEKGEPVARPDEKKFDNLTTDTKYQLRLYYSFKFEGEEYVFYDYFNVKTKAYPVPSVSATFNVRETSVDFDVHIDDDFKLLTLNSIKLYDQNGEFVASAAADDKTIDGLARNKNYVLKILYTYDLKNGKGEVEAEKVIAFSTSKAVPVVEIKPFLATETSLQFDLIVTDPNVVGRVNSIRLFKKAGNVYVDALTNTALRTFTSLTPNTEYVVEVGYIYDMDDGNGSQLITYSESMTTAKRVPTCSFEVEAAADNLKIAVTENDPDNAGELICLTVYDGATLVDKIEQTSALMTVDGLYSDREYTIVGEYKYNINDYSQSDIVTEIRTTASTYAKTAPQFTVADSGATYTSFNYQILVDDPFEICTIDNVKLMLGTINVEQTDELSGNFDGLYSNNKYTVEVYYSYDLNDGNGTRNDVYRKDIRTLKRDDISVTYKNMKALATAIKFDYDITDEDNLMSITKIELFDAQGVLVRSLDDLSLRMFEGLETESFYTIVTTFSYDLGDGRGAQTDSVSIKYGTSGSKLFVNSLSVINNNTPSVGEEVQVRLSLDNPHDLQVKAIYISDVRCEVLNNSSDLSDVIVKFIPETEGGHYTVEVTGYEYETGGILLADDLTSEYKQDIIVMGELRIVDYFAVSDDYYLNISKTPMRILEIYNPTGYEIYSLTYVSNPGSSTSNKYAETTNFTVIDRNHLLIKEEGINVWEDIFEYGRRTLTLCGITYGIEGNRVSATFDYMDCPVMLYQEKVHISTADDLLSINDNTNDGYSNNKYYILDNDIDMKGITWSGVTAYGLFDGQGHTISNLTIVIEDEGTTSEYYGLFKAFNGVIHDVHLSDIYYSIKTNSSNISVAGISASKGVVYNSSVSGTLRIQANGGYVAGVANGFRDLEHTYWRTVSTNNYVEDLQIFVSDGMQASLINFSKTERRFDIGNNNSFDYSYSLSEVNSMILGTSFVQNTTTNAKTYPYYVGDISGSGAMFVDKDVHNVEYTFVTNCDTVADFKQTGVSVASIKAERKGYTVAWYDNPEFSGKEIVFPYISEEDTTLYAKWTRIGLADTRYTYIENWIWNEETQSSTKVYIVRDFGTAEETDKTFVIGGYYKGYPVVGFEERAFDFIRYTQTDGVTAERTWEEINAMCAEYSVYFTSTVWADWIRAILAKNVYVESIINNPGSYLSIYGNNPVLTVAAETYDFYQQKYGNNSDWTIVSYTAENSPFNNVVRFADTDESNDRISVNCADADNLKQSTIYPIEDLPYTYYERDGYRWLDYNGMQFVIIDNNLYAGIESIVEDDLFRYIIYANGDVTIDAFLAPTTTTVNLTTLPYRITAIGDNVFRDSKLKNITLNEGLREIGSYAFYNCRNLTAIAYPSTLQSVGSYAFYNCTSLQRVEMNDGITKIEDFTFYNNNSISEIVWSKNLKEIGSSAFSYIYTQIDFILPEGLEKIGSSGISGCYVNVYIPASVKTIGEYGVVVYDNGYIYIAADKKLSGWSNNWSGSSEATKYWGIKEIKSDENYDYLVTNKNEVIVIKCKNTELTSVDFNFEEGEVVEIAKNAFFDIPVSELILPDSLRKIGSHAFRDDFNLKYVMIPEGVKEIGEYAFSTHTVIFSMSNTASRSWDDTISDRAILGCVGIEQNDDFVYVREINGVHIIGLTKEYVKQEVDLTVDGYTTLSVCNNVFENNKYISFVVIPEGVEMIGEYAFSGCSNLKTLTLPSTLVSVGDMAFYSCNSVDGVIYLSENVTKVGSSAFSSYFNIACAVSEKPEGWHDSWCNGEKVYWNIAEVHDDGTGDYDYLVNKDGGVIIVKCNNSAITSVDFTVFGGDVVEIGYEAFKNCDNLKGVVLPETVTSVRQYAFSSWIKYVYVPSSVVNIGYYAFYTNTVILTDRTEVVNGWNTDIWMKAKKGVTAWRIETEGYKTYIVYTVSGESEEQRVMI